MTLIPSGVDDGHLVEVDDDVPRSLLDAAPQHGRKAGALNMSSSPATVTTALPSAGTRESKENLGSSEGSLAAPPPRRAHWDLRGLRTNRHAGTGRSGACQCCGARHAAPERSRQGRQYWEPEQCAARIHSDAVEVSCPVNASD